MASSESFPNDWAQFYPPTTADSTVVSTGSGVTSPVHSTIEGRVGKSNRRRSRASRRAPTTLLNTDPTNFRAMVQQFTGAPTGPYSTQTGPVINFGVGFGDQMRQAPVVALGQYQGQQYHQQYQQPQQQQQHEGMVFAPRGDGNDGFLQGFNSSAGFFLDGMGSQMVTRGASNERTDGYFL